MTKISFFLLFMSLNCLAKEKVILFLDLNNSARTVNYKGKNWAEIESAKRAAKERGEKLIVLPLKKGEEVTPSYVDKAIRDLADSDTSISSIVSSGHDGTGSMWGESGRLHKRDIIKSYNSAYSNKPDLKDDLSSVHLWGCYTTKPNEVIDWKSEIPSLKIISGYFGAGPASTRWSSGMTLYNMMKAEQKLLAERDENRLKRLIKEANPIGAGDIGILIRGECGGLEEQYYSKKTTKLGDGEIKVEENYSPISDYENCHKPETKEKIGNLTAKFDEFYSGRSPIPQEESLELRNIYNEVGDLSLCISSYSKINPRKVAAVLFWNKMKKNFKKVFADENFEKTLEDLENSALYSPEQRAFLKLARLKYEGKSVEGEFSASDMQLLKIEHSKHYPSATDDFESFFNGSFNRNHMVPMISLLHKAVSRKKTIDPELADKSERAYHAFNKYLYQADPECMDWTRWYDGKATKETIRCRIDSRSNRSFSSITDLFQGL